MPIQLAQPLSPATSIAPAAVECSGLGKTIDDRPILEQLDLSIPAGQFVALLGANGAGKSTLLKVISGLLAPSDGELRLFGQTLRQGGPALRRHIGLLGHQPMLYRDLSARENLVFFARLYDCADPARRAVDLLDAVGLSDRADDPIRDFSRGMTQRVSIARALVHNPQLILADEPFAGLDVPSTGAIETLLHELHASGKTILLVNHDVGQSLRLADRVIVLFAGRVALDRAASEVSESLVLAALSEGGGAS